MVAFVPLPLMMGAVALLVVALLLWSVRIRRPVDSLDGLGLGIEAASLFAFGSLVAWEIQTDSVTSIAFAAMNAGIGLIAASAELLRRSRRRSANRGVADIDNAPKTD